MAADSAPDTSTDPLQILVVDDSEDTADLMCMALAQEGFRVAAVRSGQEALAHVARQQPLCMLVDYDMPGGMSGLDLARTLRARFGDDIVLIAITGSWRDDQQGIKELFAVVDHHFYKPVDWKRLLAVLEPLRD